MLKYMCLQWSEGELWAENFDILIFIECRTLNHLGSMSCREFLKKHVEYVLNKIDPEADVVADIEKVRQPFDPWSRQAPANIFSIMCLSSL